MCGAEFHSFLTYVGEWQGPQPVSRRLGVDRKSLAPARTRTTLVQPVAWSLDRLLYPGNSK